jgi:glycogen debranching enzyme
MMDRRSGKLLLYLILAFVSATTTQAQDGKDKSLLRKFALKESGLTLERRTQPGTFFNVVGHKSAALGYENRALEAWVYPLKILDNFECLFTIEGYPLPFRGPDIAVLINTRPEATVLTYSHAAFTVRQIIYAPVDEPGIIMLLDVQSVLPMTVTLSFRPRLKLAWPAGLQTGDLKWEEDMHAYFITEESKRFVGVIGSPAARDVSVMPYQEEPRDVPVQFSVEASAEALKSHFIPIVITGGVEGKDKVKATYQHLLASVQTLYEKNVAYYQRLQSETTSINTPDERLNKAFQWAKVGTDKGVATNPFLGTGLVAGYRTSGESERPGFAWFFGRDALWSSLAINSYGDFATTRTALEFLKKFQRADGKIPHEISQSASLIPWFTGYEFPWASADATVLYVIANYDYWRNSGDVDFLRKSWDSIVKAYRFSAATDTDRNRLIENSKKTKFGHGWVEDGGLYPPHEEIYMQGLWIEASRNLAEMARIMDKDGLAKTALSNAEQTRTAMEQSYWLGNQGFYAFATKRPPDEPPKADPGPNRARRLARMQELAKASIIDEDTVLPAVPLWWRTMREDRAQSQLDHLGSAFMATDWGTRIISNQSKLYDPLSYHNGSVWPLFTGWASMAAYAYGRPHVGYQALMANALLTYTSSLGYVTELLSGDFNQPFGRSSHHQIWSEAMVVTPVMRGLLGIEVSAGGKKLRFAPQLPANWDHVEARKVAVGQSKYDLTLQRIAGRLTINVTHSGPRLASEPATLELTLEPSFPLDARVRAVEVQGRNAEFQTSRMGDRLRALVNFEMRDQSVEIVFVYDEGSDVYVKPEIPAPGAESQGLRVLRSSAQDNGLRLVLEGRSGRTYSLFVRSPHQLAETTGVKVGRNDGPDQELMLEFKGSPDEYSRLDLTVLFIRR